MNAHRHQPQPNLKLDYGNIISDPTSVFAGNCENIVGFTPVPLGLAGPITLSLSDVAHEVFLPLATTEAALVASVNRGFKALRGVEGILKPLVESVGISRSAAFKIPPNFKIDPFEAQLEQDFYGFNTTLKAVSQHTEVFDYELTTVDDVLYLNIYYHTGAAMGMNMATIATKHLADTYFKPQHGLELITVSANWCSDKKPSQHTLEKGRKYTTFLAANIPADVVEKVLKTTSEALAYVGQVKLSQGSELAGAIGANAHHANMLVASYIALGQDPAHVVDGSVGSTQLEALADGSLKASVALPAVICGTLGGGTSLPVQAQTLTATGLPVRPNGLIHPPHLAALLTAGVLAGELSLMAALASGSLASSHQKLRRPLNH